MATTHTTAARNAATDAVTALIGASGNFVFRLTGTVGSPGAVVATCPFSATAFGASASGTATANAITDKGLQLEAKVLRWQFTAPVAQ